MGLTFSKVVLEYIRKQTNISKMMSVMTFNSQYLQNYPDKNIATAHWKKIFLESKPDVICVQEAIHDFDLFSDCGYYMAISSGSDENSCATVDDMVYNHQQTLSICKSKGKILCNQIYIRSELVKKVSGFGIIKSSSETIIDNSLTCLAPRSMVWIKLDCELFSTYVMCTHLTGGRFEDVHFLSDLEKERSNQVERILDWFESKKEDNDVGIIVGDYNAVPVFEENSPMTGYFRTQIVTDELVKKNAKKLCLDSDDVFDKFKQYMVSPFQVLNSWYCVYDQKNIGPTSAFGHVIDYMHSNRKLNIKSVERFVLTDQVFGQEKAELKMSDHNAVSVIFNFC